MTCSQLPTRNWVSQRAGPGAGQYIRAQNSRWMMSDPAHSSPEYFNLTNRLLTGNDDRNLESCCGWQRPSACPHGGDGCGRGVARRTALIHFTPLSHWWEQNRLAEAEEGRRQRTDLSRNFTSQVKYVFYKNEKWQINILVPFWVASHLNRNGPLWMWESACVMMEISWTTIETKKKRHSPKPLDTRWR